MMDNKRKYFKYNEQDILKILSEYFHTNSDSESINSQVILLGETAKDLRLIAVVGDGEDEELFETDLEEIDKKIDFNGWYWEYDLVNVMWSLGTNHKKEPLSQGFFFILTFLIYLKF